MTQLNHGIPVGIHHLVFIETQSDDIIRHSDASAIDPSVLRFVGTAMCALYQAATCHRKCWATGHLLEALCGRAYNLSVSALLLAHRGYYDEALNLVRGLGEIANIISLSAADKESFKQWLTSNEKTRKREFSPVKVRIMLERAAPALICATEEWYSQLCSDYTHVNPDTRPNIHNERSQAYVGGIPQEAGLRRVYDELQYVMGFIALQVCAYFEYEDLMGLLLTELRTEDSSHVG